MNNDLTEAKMSAGLNDMFVQARALYESGFFSDVKSQAQALVKVMAGAELGLRPFASMTGIHIIKGRPVLGSNLIATLIAESKRYGYKVLELNEQVCELEWFENGQSTGTNNFTMDDAVRAGITSINNNWKLYPKNMLFARAISSGARWFAPGIFGGAAVYTPDEMGLEVDDEGNIIDGQVVVETTAVQPHKPQPKTPVAPTVNPDFVGVLSDDELVIRESTQREFISATASLLGADTDEIKERMRGLGYSTIPGRIEDRIKLYRHVRDTSKQVGLENGEF